jgi:hypothetical protein
VCNSKTARCAGKGWGNDEVVPPITTPSLNPAGHASLKSGDLGICTSQWVHRMYGNISPREMRKSGAGMISHVRVILLSPPSPLFLAPRPLTDCRWCPACSALWICGPCIPACAVVATTCTSPAHLGCFSIIPPSSDYCCRSLSRCCSIDFDELVFHSILSGTPACRVEIEACQISIRANDSFDLCSCVAGEACAGHAA